MSLIIPTDRYYRDQVAALVTGPLRQFVEGVDPAVVKALEENNKIQLHLSGSAYEAQSLANNELYIPPSDDIRRDEDGKAEVLKRPTELLDLPLTD